MQLTGYLLALAPVALKWKVSFTKELYKTVFCVTCVGTEHSNNIF